MARKGSGDSGEQILLLLKERAEATNLTLNQLLLSRLGGRWLHSGSLTQLAIKLSCSQTQQWLKI